MGGYMEVSIEVENEDYFVQEERKLVYCNGEPKLDVTLEIYSNIRSSNESKINDMSTAESQVLSKDDFPAKPALPKKKRKRDDDKMGFRPPRRGKDKYVLCHNRECITLLPAGNKSSYCSKRCILCTFFFNFCRSTPRTKHSRKKSPSAAGKM
jgi:hypothetical protein